MVFLGTADVLIQWWNWVTLSSEQLNRGLVVGAPPKVRTVFIGLLILVKPKGDVIRNPNLGAVIVYNN